MIDPTEPTVADVREAALAGSASPSTRVRLGAEVATLFVMLTWGANVVAVKAAIDALDASFQEDRDANF